MLSQEIASTLSGRYHSLEVYPLSFREYLYFVVDYSLRKQNVNEKNTTVPIWGFPISIERPIFKHGVYRSLAKSLYNAGKRISQPNELHTPDLFVNTDRVGEEDIQTGWIYVVESKSDNETIKGIKDLHKIGFTSTPVEERIRNAKNEATYLYADVKVVASYHCYNLNANKLENLLHKIFGSVCLNIDLFDDNGQRITPREWFVVPFDVIDEVISLLLNENILNYEYDATMKKIRLKG